MATGRIGTTPVLTTRWSKAPSAGTTSLSGLDDNSVSLVYSVGYEAVYQNGVLLSRGNDYTATNGTTITLTTATVAGDIIEVFANQTIPLTDTYSQTVSDGRFIKNTLTTTTGDIIYASAANTPARLGIGSTNQVLTVSGGVPTWATASSGSTLLAYKTDNYGSNYSTTSTSFVDVNATLFALTFTAPSSGNVILRATMPIEFNGSGNAVFNWREGTTDLSGTDFIVVLNGSIFPYAGTIGFSCRVSGLTSGNSYTYKLGMKTTNSGTTFFGYTNNSRYLLECWSA